MSLENAPEHFICPLTLEVMANPLQHKVTKHSFERKAIMEWIYFGKATCPLTRTTLHPKDFVENKALMREIDQWKFDNQVAEEEDEEDFDASFLDLDSLLEVTVKKFAVPKRSPKTSQPKRDSQPKQDPKLSQPKRDSLVSLLSLRSRVLQKREARMAASQQ